MTEQDRTRFLKLLQGPLIPPDSHPKTPGLRDVLFLTALRRHFTAHYRGWVIGAVAVVSLVILVVAVTVKGRGAGKSVQLQALDQSGRLQIRWDPNADPIRRAVDAKLYIVDGSERLYVKLDSARLRRGAVSYVRRSDRVELRMALAEPDGKSVEEQATFVGTRPPNADEFLLEAARPAGLPEPSSSTAQAAEAELPREMAGDAAPSGHRARKKPLEQSGTSLPFTCSTGDTFLKTDAAAGWDTFTCRGNNVWSVAPAGTHQDRPATPGPNTTTLTAKPTTEPAT